MRTITSPLRFMSIEFPYNVILNQNIHQYYGVNLEPKDVYSVLIYQYRFNLVVATVYIKKNGTKKKKKNYIGLSILQNFDILISYRNNISNFNSPSITHIR